jgi:hypothetical protein
MDDQQFIFNGVDATTGDYLLTATPDEITAFWEGEELDPAHGRDVAAKDRRAKGGVLAPMPGVDTRDLAQTGWAIVFPHDGDPAIEAALAPLIEHRRKQAERQSERRFRVLRGVDGYQPGETPLAFLTRHGAEWASRADPDQFPYYVLLVAEPTRIPFAFQYQLDVERAVGRIAFDTIEEYERYAASVVAAETAAPRPRTATFFAVHHEGDPATELSANTLVAPLAARVGEKCPAWQDGIRTVLAAEATKAQLRQLVGGDQTPSFLFTASHGLGFPNDQIRQRTDQGGLLCQDCPGPRVHHGLIPKDWYLAADDIGDDARVQGLVAFHFACYGAGTPHQDDFAHLKPKRAGEIPEQPFVAALPRRLLGHPAGGALAVIGHVERAWGYSIAWDGNPTLNAYVAAVQLLLEGQPVGAALEPINNLYASLSTTLVEEWKQQRFGKIVDHDYIARLWMVNSDARNYVIAGDPAVRLNTVDPPAATPDAGPGAA